MSNLCKCCGKKLNFMSGASTLSSTFNEPICINCNAVFVAKKNDLVNIKSTQENLSQIDKAKEDLIKTIQSSSFTDEGKRYVISYCENLYQEKLKEIDVNTVKQQEESERLKAAEEQQSILNEKLSRLQQNPGEHLLTTGYEFTGHQIVSYAGIVSGSVVLGTGFLSEFGASVSDLFGTRSEMFSNKLEAARTMAMDKLRENSVRAGGNAVIGVKFDYVVFSNNMIGVVANGTSVVINKE